MTGLPACMTWNRRRRDIDMLTKKAKRADGRYQVSATVGHDEHGIAIRKYFYGETQKEAVA